MTQRTLLAAVLFVGSQLAAEPKDEKKMKDEVAILGTWKVEAVDTGGLGDPKPEEIAKARVTFKKDGKVVMSEQDGNEREFTYVLDPAAKTKTVDLVAPKESIFGVYELDGDTLKLGVTQSGSDSRPVALKANGKGIVVMTLKRVKEEKKDR